MTPEDPMLTPSTYDVMDDALEELASSGPDLRNGLTNHAPMAIEALCALGRADAVRPWMAAYRDGLLPRPPRRQRIAVDAWRHCLAQSDRFEDWAEFFRERLEEAPWREVVGRWTAHLAPGICASAAHGVIRVGHAVRSLTQAETPPRRNELADALGYWAANYQELPVRPTAATVGLDPEDAIARVPIVPPAQRRFSGTIVSSLEALDDFPPFAEVIQLVDLDGDPHERVAQLSDLFSRVYLANAHDTLTSVVFVHGITSLVALDHLLPCLDASTTQTALRYAWQASCGLYAAFGSRPPAADHTAAPMAAADLIERAIAHGDEHVIKLTEACLHQYTRRPSPSYLAAAHDSAELLPRPTHMGA